MFDFYIAHEYWFAAVQLALAMLGMGATLALSDFTRVATDPRGFSIGIALQLLLVPLIHPTWCVFPLHLRHLVLLLPRFGPCPFFCSIFLKHGFQSTN